MSKSKMNGCHHVDPREEGLPVSLTQMAHGMFDPDHFADLGSEGDGTGTDLDGATPHRRTHRQSPRDYWCPGTVEGLDYYEVSDDGAWSLPPFTHGKDGRKRPEPPPPESFASDFAILSEVGKFNPGTAHAVVFSLREDENGGTLIRAEVRHGRNGTSHTRVVEFRPEGDAADWAARLNAVQAELEVAWNLQVKIVTSRSAGHNPRECRKCAREAAVTRAERNAHHDPNADAPVVWSV